MAGRGVGDQRIEEDEMHEVMAIARALADENRTRVLMCLGGGELCLCEIIELLGLAPSTVSKHLSILQRAGLVESRKEGRWVYYDLPKKRRRGVREAMRWVAEALKDDPQVKEDAIRVKAVRKMDKAKLCARYGRGRKR